MKKALKIILYLLFALIVFVLVAGIFVKKDYSVVREITIQRSDTVVYEYLRHLNNHTAFNIWLQKDPEVQISTSGTDGTEGFVYGYRGNKDVGEGEMEIAELIPYRKIGIELRFIKPMESTAQAPMTVEAQTDSTSRVSWQMNARMSYPMNTMLLFVDMNEMLGKDLQRSLEQLKVELERTGA